MAQRTCDYSLCGPSFVAPLPGGGLCVSDCYNNRVRCLDECGVQIFEIGGAVGGAPLDKPSGLAWNGELLYVAERWAHRVRCFRVREEPAGSGFFAPPTLVASVGGREGSSTSTFSHPMGLALAADGRRLFVADSYNHRVCVLDAATLEAQAAFGSDGERYASLARRADEPGALRYPVGLTTHGGEVFVADSENHRIAVFREDDYAFARSIGAPTGKRGRAPGTFNEPEGVAVAHGRLVVSEAAGCRLQVLTLAGMPLQICSGFVGRLAGVCCVGDKLWVEDFFLDEVISLNLAAPAALRWADGPVEVM